jgi:hypothetical protein
LTSSTSKSSALRTTVSGFTTQRVGIPSSGSGRGGGEEQAWLSAPRTLGSLTRVPEAFHRRGGRGAGGHGARPCRRFTAGILDSWLAEREAPLPELCPASMLTAPAMEAKEGSDCRRGGARGTLSRPPGKEGGGRRGAAAPWWVGSALGRPWRRGAARRSTNWLFLFFSCERV